MLYNIKSKFGFLHHIYTHSGIGENPVITNKQLSVLRDLCVEQINVMEDTGNKHSAVWFRRELNAIEDMIDSRKQFKEERF